MNIDDLQAGREMDALVAEKVMGWKRVEPFVSFTVSTGETKHHGASWARPAHSDEGADFIQQNEPPHYSTDIAAAFQVVERVIETKGVHFKMWCGNHYPDIYGAEVSFTPDADAHGETFAEAICRAALKAVGA